MSTYMIFSSLSPDAVKEPAELKRVAATVSDTIRSQCPGVHWKESYAVLGRFDVVDIVEADDLKDVEKAAMVIRSYGHAATETVPATPWKEFINSL